jgi:hypothetical protein
VEASVNYFSELYKVDVSKHIEKKGKFSYVSWPFAVAELKKRHPDATWEVCRFDGAPFMSTNAGVFVEVAVTVNGCTLSQIHPVLNGQNRPIAQPNAFDINTSIQRALVKAIALHGLGLFVYAGEDLPEGEEPEPVKEKVIITPSQGIADLMSPEEMQYFKELAVELIAIVAEGDPKQALTRLDSENLEADQKVALWSLLDSKTRSAIKKAKE